MAAEYAQPLNASDEDETRLPAAADPPSGGGGSSSSVGSGRKPRGRPPGSKNKPKPPVVITRESDSAMHPLILELSAGSDVLESVSAFARRLRVGISVVSGSGAVSNVALRHPTSPSSIITLAGRFDILSLAGTFLPPLSAAVNSPFTISVAGSQGQVIGGTVAGALTAAGTVVLVAASFGNAEFHRLPAAEKEEDVKPGGVESVSVYSLAAGPTNPLPGEQAHDRVLWATPSSSRAPPHSDPPPPPPPPPY